MRDDAPKWYQNKKDIDNLIKFVLDALNGKAYIDDRQVVSIRSTKVYADHARTQIRMKLLTNDDGLPGV